MPTALPRIQVTQTEPVARALDVAAREWPGVPRSELVARLLVRGGASVEAARAARRAERRKALLESRGTFADAYPPGYLDELRKDWPD
ncbi:MAG: hypothetical protein QM602_03460 [Microbacterium sp.]